MRRRSGTGLAPVLLVFCACRTISIPHGRYVATRHEYVPESVDYVSHVEVDAERGLVLHVEQVSRGRRIHADIYEEYGIKKLAWNPFQDVVELVASPIIVLYSAIARGYGEVSDRAVYVAEMGSVPSELAGAALVDPVKTFELIYFIVILS